MSIVVLTVGGGARAPISASSFVAFVDADLRFYGMFANDDRKLLSILLGAEPLNQSLQLVFRVGLEDVIEVVGRLDRTKIGSAKALLSPRVVSGFRSVATSEGC
jgi:hypothetical protein